MGRPKKKLPRQCGGMDVYEAITDMARRGLRETDIARCLGMHLNTWVRIKEENQKALDAFEAGRGAEHEALIGTLHKAALQDGNVAAAMFLLKTRYGYRETMEVQQENRVKVMFELPGSTNPADYFRIIEGEKTKQLSHDDDN